MIKTYILFTLVLFSIVLSQSRQGKKSIDGNFTYSSTMNEDKEVYITATFNPSIGYFIANRLELSLEIDYSKTEWKGEYSQIFQDEEDTSVGIGTTLYFTPKLYLGLALFDPDVDVDDDNFASLRTGWLMPLSRQVFLDYGLVYTVGVGKNNDNISNLGIGGGVKVIY